MKKLIVILCLILFNQMFAFGQVFLDSSVTNEVFFGPSNAYPISIEICQSYIEYLDEIKSDNLDKSKSIPHKVIEKFIVEIDELINDWSEMQNKIDSLVRIKGNCFHQIEIIENSAEVELEVFEYIDITKMKLDKTKWEKQRVKNCIASDPNDCFIWCEVKFEKVYIDRNNKNLDSENLKDDLNFTIENQRIVRAISLDIAKTNSFKLFDTSQDKFFSISEIEKFDCK